MDAKKKIVIDAGHGGDRDPGAVFEERKEKDDNLRLALAVGKILEENGVDVFYTRIDDVYDTPYEKAAMGNEAQADYFVSIHRNAAREPGCGSGTMTLIYGGTKESPEGEETEDRARGLAAQINRELSRAGFTDLGIFERPDLVVLRKTRMPAVLVEAGFIDNPEDNRRFEEQFDELAAAIATGILDTLSGETDQTAQEGMYYMIQTGAYRVRSLAEQQLAELESQGFPGFLVCDGTYCRVRVGAFKNLDNAVRMERELRRKGFPTVMIYERESR